MAPIITGVESIFNPIEAISMAHSKIAKSLLESSNSSYILFLNSINEYSLLFVTISSFPS
ncbi:Uncharacterised protein [Streptococcus pneumoniae]|nr:Uncharacterised protein [Streptococcus pneumoniae]